MEKCEYARPELRQGSVYLGFVRTQNGFQLCQVEVGGTLCLRKSEVEKKKGLEKIVKRDPIREEKGREENNITKRKSLVIRTRKPATLRDIRRLQHMQAQTNTSTIARDPPLMQAVGTGS